MAKENPARNADARVIKLSTVKFRPRHVTDDACIIVDSQGYVGETRAVGAELIDEVSRAQGHQKKPTYFLVADSEKHAGDIICVPTMTKSEDHIELTWLEEGRLARMNLAKLLTFKQIQMPQGTRMVINLYQEIDSVHGPCVGMKLQSAQFVPKRKGKARKKASEPAEPATT